MEHILPVLNRFQPRGGGLLKLRSLISPLREILIYKIINYILSITFMFVKCLHSSVVVTPFKYERDIIQVTSVLIILKK